MAVDITSHAPMLVSDGSYSDTSPVDLASYFYGPA